jgi:hypothetical protein
MPVKKKKPLKNKHFKPYQQHNVLESLKEEKKINPRKVFENYNSTKSNKSNKSKK